MSDLNTEDKTAPTGPAKPTGSSAPYRNSGDRRNYEENDNSRPRRDGDSYSGGRPYRGGGGGGGRGKVYFKKKVCRFCTQNLTADYKNPDFLRRFITDRGKILPRRITGTCAKHQRRLAAEIKKARVLAYLPYVKQ